MKTRAYCIKVHAMFIIDMFSLHEVPWSVFRIKRYVCTVFEAPWLEGDSKILIPILYHTFAAVRDCSSRYCNLFLFDYKQLQVRTWYVQIQQKGGMSKRYSPGGHFGALGAIHGYNVALNSTSISFIGRYHFFCI